MRRLHAAELHDHGRDLAAAPCAGLIFDTTAQSADPALGMAALHRAFDLAGGRRIAARVERLLCGLPHRGVVLADGRMLQADRMLVAAGVSSRAVLRAIGVPLPVIAERGYHTEWSHGGSGALKPMSARRGWMWQGR